MKKLKKVIVLGIVCLLALNYFVSAYAEENFIVCIDPGHQAKGDPKGEPIAPGSSQKKARVASGTTGVATKKPEYVVNREAALILKRLLEEKGYKVVMTREVDEVNVSNVERAKIANDAKADMTIRLHCDSINNGGKTGAVLIVPSKTGRHTQAIYEPSYQFAKCLEKSLKASGVKVNGVFERGDMTGFNWSKVPVIIFEMGFMSNWNEDQMLSDASYQTKLMTAIITALEVYRVQNNQ